MAEKKEASWVAQLAVVQVAAMVGNWVGSLVLTLDDVYGLVSMTAHTLVDCSVLTMAVLWADPWASLLVAVRVSL